MTPSLWPQSPVPATGGAAWQWRLSSLPQLSHLRAELRDHLCEPAGGDDPTGDRILLAVDRATDRVPEPAIDRDRAHGGMGLHLVAELTTGHGWAVDDGHKHVWAWIAAVP